MEEDLIRVFDFCFCFGDCLVGGESTTNEQRSLVGLERSTENVTTTRRKSRHPQLSFLLVRSLVNVEEAFVSCSLPAWRFGCTCGQHSLSNPQCLLVVDDDRLVCRLWGVGAVSQVGTFHSVLMLPGKQDGILIAVVVGKVSFPNLYRSNAKRQYVSVP